MSSFTFFKHKDFSANAPENTIKASHYHAFNPTRILGFCLLSLICGLPFPMILITGDDVYCNVPLVSFVMCIFVACVFDKAYRILNDGTVQKIIKSLYLCLVCTDPQKLDQNLTIRRSVFLWQNIVLNSRRKSF